MLSEELGFQEFLEDRQGNIPPPENETLMRYQIINATRLIK